MVALFALTCDTKQIATTGRGALPWGAKRFPDSEIWEIAEIGAKRCKDYFFRGLG